MSFLLSITEDFITNPLTCYISFPKHSYYSYSYSYSYYAESLFTTSVSPRSSGGAEPGPAVAPGAQLLLLCGLLLFSNCQADF